MYVMMQVDKPTPRLTPGSMLRVERVKEKPGRGLI
jgi:hypothetical protein